MNTTTCSRVELIDADELRVGDEFLTLIGFRDLQILDRLQRFVDAEGCGRRVRGIARESDSLLAISLDRVSPVPLLVGTTARVVRVARAEVQQGDDASAARAAELAEYDAAQEPRP